MRKWVLCVSASVSVHLRSLVRGDAVRYKITQCVMVSLCISWPDWEMRRLNGLYIYMMGAYGKRPIFAWRGSLQISLRIENATFKNNAFWYKIELKIANLLIMAAYPHIKEWFPDVLTKYGKHCGMIIKRFSLIVTLYYFANDCFLILEAKVKFCEMDCNA